MKTINYYATYYSPGTFISESSSLKLKSLDVREACKKAKSISERYGAKPYGFILQEIEEGEIIKNGEAYKMQPKTKYSSGMHFLTGRVLTLKDIPDTKENSILRSNMEGNGYGAVVENTNSYKSTMPFGKKDVIVDWDGNIIDEGKNYTK